ncbi:MAG: hypothetical protein GXP62_04170 [Oligoflexia bacterium]|nr:hypothetical protein [Oligoflexia bacterium]
MRSPVLLAAALTLPLLAACDDLGRNAAKIFPFLEKVDEDLAEPTVVCDPPFSSPTPRNGIVADIGCGSVVEGNNSTGSRVWGDSFYQTVFCTPQRNQYDNSPEDIYRLKVPSDYEAEVTLVSDCVDLDLVGVSWQERSIPGAEHRGAISQCDMDTSRKGGKLRLNAVGRDWYYLVGIDGKGGATGNYRLKVKCYTFR